MAIETQPAPVHARVFHGVETSATSAGAPSSSAIEAVMNALPQAVASMPTLFSGDQGLLREYLPDGKLRGHWAGPHTRITRRLNFPSLTKGYTTHAANVWVIPASGTSEAVADKEFELVGLVMSKALLNQSPDWSTEWLAYAPKLNGDLGWWANQQAARTRYRDEWPEMAARLASTENPTGPNSPDVRAPTFNEVIDEAASVAARKSSGGSSAATLVLVGLALFAGYKFLSKDS